jgi:hypothetical protein
MIPLLINFVQKLEDSLAGHNIPLKELISLLPERHGLLIVLA